MLRDARQTRRLLNADSSVIDIGDAFFRADRPPKERIAEGGQLYSAQMSDLAEQLR